MSEEFGPEARVFTADGEPMFAPLPGEIVDEYGRPARKSPYWQYQWYREQVRKSERELMENRGE